MYCKKCGNELPDNSKICLKCGETTVSTDNSKPPQHMENRFVKKTIKAFVISAVILLIAGFVFLGFGFDKKLNYYHSSTGYFDKNAYVGGDAYNYIINSNYFTGYLTLASACLISSIILFTGSALIKVKIDTSEKYNPVEVKPVESTVPVVSVHEDDFIQPDGGSLDEVQ